MLKKITKLETEDGKVFDTQEEAEEYMFEKEKEAMTHHTDVDRAEFEAWWESDGQFCRAGGGDYEKTFAFRAWMKAHQTNRSKVKCIDCEDAGVNTKTGYDCSYCFGDLQAAPVPQGWKMVPVELLERIQESLGSFVSDHGWSQSDMDTADALDGLLAAAHRTPVVAAVELPEPAARTTSYDGELYWESHIAGYGSKFGAKLYTEQQVIDLLKSV